MGRILAVEAAPQSEFASAAIDADHDLLRRALDSPPDARLSLRPIMCRLQNGEHHQETRVWITHTDRECFEDSTTGLILTTLDPNPAVFQPGAKIHLIDLLQPAASRRWEAAGHFTRLADTPEWLAAALAQHVWHPSDIVSAAKYPWDARIHRCQIAPDGKALRLEGIMGWGEEVAHVSCHEGDTSIDLLVQLGIDPTLQPPPIERRTRARPAVRRHWRAEVKLSAELADRAVVDTARGDQPENASAGWQQWRAG